MRKKQFILKWFKEFRWINNPFRLEIFNPIEKYLTGYDKEKQKLNYFIIENYSFGSIRAEKGAGKTMILLWLKQSLQSYKGSILPIYYKAEKRSESLTESLVDNFTNMRDKIVMGSLFKLRLKKIASKIKSKFNRKKDAPHSIEEMQQQQHQEKSIYELIYHKKYTKFSELEKFFEKKLKGQRLVVLIDNAHMLSEPDVNFVSEMLESNLLCQVVATFDKGEKNLFKVKDSLKMNLGQLSYKEVENMIRVRIASVGGGGIDPFNEHMLHGIYNKGNKNPLHILKIAYDQAVKLSLKHISDRKKGILPKKEKIEVFNEADEYRKLLEEERRKAKDPNELIMEASFKEPKLEQKQNKETPPEQKSVKKE